MAIRNFTDLGYSGSITAPPQQAASAAMLGRIGELKAHVGR